MTPERWARIKDLFDEALALNPAERDAFVATRCSGDPDVRANVERLLAANPGITTFFGQSPVEGIVAALAECGRFTGTIRGRYRIGRRVAAGGMGEVYEAVQTETGRRVAIKVLTEEGALSTERLKHEAAHASVLHHPNVCEVYEIAEDESGAYIVMEFVDGTNLVELMSEGGIATTKTVALALQLADAIAHAHEHQIVHRDLKSANVMVGADGRLKVLDFGLARRLPREVESEVSLASVTDVGVIAGTLSYMAPELLRGERADSRSDVWAFGVVLHELLTGAQPFEGRTPFELTSAILRERPRNLARSVPAALRVLRDNCLNKDPRDRYQNGGELLAALRLAQAGRRVSRRRMSTASRWRTKIAAVAAVTVLAGSWAITRWLGHGPRTVSIAVLPFRDLSPNGASEYFGNGVADALSDRLGTIETVRVAARESTRRFQDEPSPAAIRRALAADVVVRGSVRHDAERVRLTLDMIDAATGQMLWHDTRERPAHEILALENDAVQALIVPLKISLSPARAATLQMVRAVDPAVYETYLKGRFQWNKRTSASLNEAVALFSEAVSRDPTYAPAHAALADCYNQLGTVMVGSASPVDMRPRARAEAIAAIQTDASLAEAHATLAYISHYSWDWATADREFRRALELNPNLALAHTWYGNFLMSQARFREAIAELQRAEALDPFSLVVVTNVGWVYANARRSREAIAAFERALAIDPSYVQARMRLGTELAIIGRYDDAIREQQQVVNVTHRAPHALGNLAIAYAKAGRRDDALAVLNELLGLAQHQYVSPATMYLTYFPLGDRERGFAWLDRALEERSNGIVYLLVDPALDGMRDDPRYRRTVDQAGLTHAPW